MDEQNKPDEQEEQNKPDDQRKLLLEIAGCEIAKERVSLLIREKGEIDLESHDCNAVCKSQYDKIYHELVENGPEQEVTKAMFHVPEPWNGNLETAEILFVGPNPSIDLKENFPKFESEEWSDDEVVKFFGKRLESYKNRYWIGIRKYAAWILDVTDPSWASDKKKEEEKRQSLLASLSPKSYIASLGVRRESKRPLKRVSTFTPTK